MTDFLRFDELPGEDDEWVVVETPEFGEGKSVRVRAMTVREWNYMLRQAYSMNGSAEPSYNPDYNEVALAAAMCTYDGEGKRVFGEPMQAAISNVGKLHRRYRPALTRIHAQVMRLSELVSEPDQKKD